MDLSKVPDAQRQQLEQLQKQFHEHQKKQQEDSASAAAAAAAAAVQQQQQPPPSAYDPSQVHHQSYDPSQAYDQSYYYNYNHQEQQQQPQQHPQPPQFDPSYYQNYHPNAAYPQQPQQQQQQYTHSEAYPVVPSEQQQQRNEGSVSSGLGLGHVQVQDPYVDQNNHHQVNSQPNPGYPVPPGLNAAAAAAVAALSQLTQFAGSMGAAERAMGGGGYGPPMAGGGHYGQGHFRPPGGHSPYRGGGRRGGGPFRGGGRGFRPPGSGPPFHGRGRGRGSGRGGGRGRGGRHDQSSSSHPEASAVEEAKPSEGAEPSAAQPNPQQPSRIAWCELCRVDCTSKEILEQHKNGKRHKKNLHMKGGAYQPAAETQKDENAPTDNNVSEQEAADKQTKAGTTDDDNNKVETEGNDGQEKKPWMNTKRKMRGGGRGGGRGAKRQRQGAMGGPPKPKIVIPLMCDLCNVKCDTQEVFDRHVGGKKHIAKLKRFEGHQAMYGPTAVQALYPPNPLSQTMGGPQQPAYYPATAAAAATDAYVAPAPAPSQAQQNPNPQLADAPLEFGTKNEAPQVTATGV